jgi:PKD repeat protein
VPVITFTANGTYTINLAAGNTQGTSNSSQVVTVLTCSAPIAGFNAPASVCNNIALTLTNTSVGAPNPSITITTNPANNVTVTPGSGSLYTLKFATAGVYTINLLASSAAGTSAVTQTVNVNSCNPVVNFSVPSLFYRCSNVVRMPTANTTTAPVTGLITYTWSSLPSAGVTFSPSATASNVSIAFNSSVTSVYTITLRATNSSGTASAVQTVTMDFCTGIIENKNLMSNLDVFPNPAKESLHISLPSGIDLYQVKLVNVLGAVVYDEKIVNKENTVINLSNKPKGVYFLTVIANNEKVTKKIILE